MRQLVARALHGLGLFDPVFDHLQMVRRLGLPDLRARRRLQATGEAGPLPLPPLLLAIAAAGTADPDWFLASGRAGADCLSRAADAAGLPIDRCRRVLDLGCGCGRVIRHLQPNGRLEVYGCDRNRRAVSWCSRNLRPRQFLHTGIEPPIRLDSASCDLVYAFSVFTHLPEGLQFRWLAEVRRLLTERGVFVLSLMGDSYRETLDENERALYDSGSSVIRSGESAGSNRCGAYHPPAYVRSTLLAGWQVLEHEPSGALGNPTQDLWVVEPEPAPPEEIPCNRATQATPRPVGR